MVSVSVWRSVSLMHTMTEIEENVYVFQDVCFVMGFVSRHDFIPIVVSFFVLFFGSKERCETNDYILFYLTFFLFNK